MPPDTVRLDVETAAYLKVMETDRAYIKRVADLVLLADMPWKAASDKARSELFWSRAALLDQIARSLIEPLLEQRRAGETTKH